MRKNLKTPHVSRDQIVAFLAISPSVLLIGIFVYGFIVWNIRVSLSGWQGFVPDFKWIGFQNYIDLFTSQRFQANVRNIIFFSIVFILTNLLLGRFLAIILYRNTKYASLFRSLFLFPLAISSVVTGVIWRWILSPGNEATGPTGINQLISRIGVPNFSFGWYTDSRIIPGMQLGKVEWFIPVGMIGIVLAAIWQISGYVTALYYAGLQNMPQEIIEAAKIDGANEAQIVRHIIMPILTNTTSSIVIILGYISLNIFDLIITITPGGGPAFVTEVPGLLMYRRVFQSHSYAEGAAIASIMFLGTTLIFIPYLLNHFHTEQMLNE